MWASDGASDLNWGLKLRGEEHSLTMSSVELINAAVERPTFWKVSIPKLGVAYKDPTKELAPGLYTFPFSFSIPTTYTSVTTSSSGSWLQSLVGSKKKETTEERPLPGTTPKHDIYKFGMEEQPRFAFAYFLRVTAYTGRFRDDITYALYLFPHGEGPRCTELRFSLRLDRAVIVLPRPAPSA